MNNESITEKEISKTIDEINSFNETGTKKLFEQYVTEQPAITAYLAAVAQSMDQDDSRSFLFELSIIVYHAFKRKYKQVKEISFEELERIDDDENGRMEKLSLQKDDQLNESLFHEAIKMLFDKPEPALNRFIFQRIGEFFELDDEDGFSLPEMNENNNFDLVEQDAGIMSAAMNVIIECFCLAVSKPSLKIVK